MADEQDKSQKTEDPTHKRLDDAAKKGQIPSSREVYSFFLLLVLAALILFMAAPLMSDLKYRLSGFIIMPHDIDLDDRSLLQSMSSLMLDLLIIMTLPIVAAFSAILAGTIMQNKFNVSTEPITPKLEKISVLKGLGRLFSRRSFVEFTKGILKICIVGAVAAIAVYPYKEHLRLLPDEDMYDLLSFIITVCGRMMIGVCIIMFFIAIVDFMYQKFEFIQNLKMSKQEIKDEYKQQEGDPHIKQKLRQIRRERLANQMISKVPEADVVITNPTHFAIALQYDSQSMNAPKVLAKGKDKVALRIKEIAEKNKIIVMRNPALARLLFDHAQVDEEVPYEYYQAVAEVIGYVYRLRGIDLAKPA